MNDAANIRSLRDAQTAIAAAISTKELPGEDDYDAMLRANSARQNWTTVSRYVYDAPVARCARIELSDVPAFRAWLSGVLS